MFSTSVAWCPLLIVILVPRRYILNAVLLVLPFWSFYIFSFLIVITFSSNFLSTSLKRHHYLISFGISYNAKHRKRNLHWQENEEFLSGFFCETFSVSEAQKLKYLSLPIFSPFIFRMREDKEMVCNPGLIKFISILFRKAPWKERNVILWRAGRSRETPNTGASCPSFLFERFLLTVV